MDNSKIHKKINKNLEKLVDTIKYINKNNTDNYDETIHSLFIIIFNILFLVRKVIKFFYITFDEYINYNVKYKKQINNILVELNGNSHEIIDKYNSIYLNNKTIKFKDILKNYSFNSRNNNKIMNSNIVYTNVNLEILDISSIDNINKIIMPDESKNSNNINSIDYNLVDIGFNNLYKLHIFNSLNDNIPFNLLVFVKEINQIVIKIGNEKKFQYINSRLYKTYNLSNKTDNDRSILCNNNIKKLNKKCLNGVNCKYYHDIIIGYKDNFHKNRQFSCNPIIYNCVNFKDGEYVEENVKKIEWHDAINLYQSSLSCILIACIHSTK
jgi:hypothetical protein